MDKKLKNKIYSLNSLYLDKETNSIIWLQDIHNDRFFVSFCENPNINDCFYVDNIVSCSKIFHNIGKIKEISNIIINIEDTNLIGKEKGFKLRKQINLDELDTLNEIIIINFNINSPTITSSFIIGLFEHSILKFADSFDNHYHINFDELGEHFRIAFNTAKQKILLKK